MEKRFGALRFIATVLKVLAWIFLVLGILIAIIAMLGGAAGGLMGGSGYGRALAGGLSGLFGGFIVGIGILISALLTFLGFLGSAEFILVQLAIEENTRETAHYLKGGELQRHP